MKKLINLKIRYIDDKNESIGVDDILDKSLLGYYAGNGHYNRDKNIELLNSLDDTKFDKDYFNNNISTLYRLPNLTLSRDKLANFKEECDFKIVRDKEKADICVIGEKTIEKMMEMTYKSSYDFKEWKNYIDRTLKYTNLTKDDQSTILDFVKSIEDEYGEDIIIVSTSSNYWYSNSDLSKYQESVNAFLQRMIEPDDHTVGSFDIKIKPITGDQHYTYYIKPDYNEDYIWIHDNKDKLIKDTKLNKLCVEDSVILTKEEFERLNDLVSSNDEENVNIGLTMMANCNVEESKVYLALLFAYNHDNMKGRKVWNHVNFKYLRSVFSRYINMGMSSWGGAYDTLIKYLIEDKCLTMWTSRFIASTMFNRVIKSHLNVGKRDCVFTICEADLKLKSEYADQLIDENDNKLSELMIAGSHNDDLPF